MNFITSHSPSPLSADVAREASHARVRLRDYPESLPRDPAQVRHPPLELVVRHGHHPLGRLGPDAPARPVNWINLSNHFLRLERGDERQVAARDDVGAHANVKVPDEGLRPLLLAVDAPGEVPPLPVELLVRQMLHPLRCGLRKRSRSQPLEGDDIAPAIGVAPRESQAKVHPTEVLLELLHLKGELLNLVVHIVLPLIHVLHNLTHHACLRLRGVPGVVAALPQVPLQRREEPAKKMKQIKNQL